MNKLIVILSLFLTGCVSNDVGQHIRDQYMASLDSVMVGNSYADMIVKVGHRPHKYTCVESRCTAEYIIHYKSKETKSFVFVGDVVVSIGQP